MYDDATRLKSPFSIVQGAPSAVQPMEPISETRLHRMLKSELVQMVMDFQQKVMDFQQKDQELARLHELEKENEKKKDKENKEDKDRGDDREQEGKDEPSDDENSPTTKLEEESLVTIFIHDVANRKTESVQVELDDKPWLVKSILADRHNIRKRDQRLLYKGTEVYDNGRSLHAYGISADDTLDLFIVIAGGGKRTRGSIDIEEDDEGKDRHAIPEFFGEITSNDGDSQNIKDILSTDMKNLRQWLDKLTPQEAQDLWDDIPKSRGMGDQNLRTLVRHHHAYKKLEARSLFVFSANNVKL